MSSVPLPDNAAASEPRLTPPPHRKRDKKQFSCGFCRQRKLRCDRRQPCGACTIRGIGPSCVYPSGSPQVPAIPRAQSHLGLANLEERLKHIEDLVLSNMNSARAQRHDNAGLVAQPSILSTPAQPVPFAEPGTMLISSKGTTYFASPHWEAIMDEISDLKNDFRQIDETQAQIEPADTSCRTASNTPLLLYGSMQPVSKEALLSALPERSAADRLIFQYFNEISILPACVVHPPRFLEQYEDFWANPSAVSLSWLGLLYGVLSLADLFSSDPEHRHSEPQPNYLGPLVQCLIAADYVRGGPNIIECLTHYYLVEFYLNPVTEVGNWMVAGIITQLAIRMGYHRDPSHFPRISAFEGEIRRRVWATVHIFDTTMAMLVGAPRIISDGTWTTRPPGNIADADLNVECVQLPASRADTEVTEVSFLLARYNMSLAMGRLVDLSLLNKLESQEDVQNAEARLEATYESIPEKFKFTSLVRCLSDHPVRVAHRVIITCLHNKARIILYQRQLRKFASASPAAYGSSGGHDDWASSARIKCLDAGLEIIEHLVFLDTETQPGGTLTTLRSKVSALVIHECLVATAALSMYLYSWSNVPLAGEGDVAVSKPKIEAMLRRSYQTWSRWSSWSTEAKRAIELLDSLFRRLVDEVPDVELEATALPIDEMGLNIDWGADIFGAFFPLPSHSFS